MAEEVTKLAEVMYKIKAIFIVNLFVKLFILDFQNHFNFLDEETLDKNFKKIETSLYRDTTRNKTI